MQFNNTEKKFRRAKLLTYKETLNTFKIIFNFCKFQMFTILHVLHAWVEFINMQKFAIINVNKCTST